MYKIYVAKNWLFGKYICFLYIFFYVEFSQGYDHKEGEDPDKQDIWSMCVFWHSTSQFYQSSIFHLCGRPECTVADRPGDAVTQGSLNTSAPVLHTLAQKLWNLRIPAWLSQMWTDTHMHSHTQPLSFAQTDTADVISFSYRFSRDIFRGGYFADILGKKFTMSSGQFVQKALQLGEN